MTDLDEIVEAFEPICQDCKVKPMKCRGRCGSCYQRWRYNTNPQWRLTVNQRGKRWRHAHKAQVSRADHKYYLAHKEELAKYERAWHLNKAYGISLQQYQMPGSLVFR